MQDTENFLTDIVIKIIFSEIDLTAFQENIPHFIKEIQGEYPTNIPLVNQKVQIKSTKKSNEISGKFYPSILFRKNDEKQLTLRTNEILLEYNGKYYDSFDNKLSDDLTLINNALQIYEIPSILHISMRYINQIPRIDNILAKEYTHFFNEKNSVRTMIRTEYAEGDHHIIFNYGEYNSNYPSTNIKHNFILDYETYTDTPQNFNQLLNTLSEIHQINKKYFCKTTCRSFQKEVGVNDGSK